jgi:3-dehydroquinate dehydratase II
MTQIKVLLMHGPNLNLLGKREVDVYGSLDNDQLLQALKNNFPQVDLTYFQSNSEKELIEKLHTVNDAFDGVLINAGAFSHTSIAMADAVRIIKHPVISIHISNIVRREAFRHKDFIADACGAGISGLGFDGYTLAMECLLDTINPV